MPMKASEKIRIGALPIPSDHPSSKYLNGLEFIVDCYLNLLVLVPLGHACRLITYLNIWKKLRFLIHGNALCDCISLYQ